ncbi:MAG: ABC transporter ATP-binding protein [Candidatus Cloacimonetes bacterium]|jgi:putative ABC transport system ATP-binding protein|nr:ABC transporter ATP-binding protein [Candidatus Cloacimonadota bacterium]MBT6994760.1 ABC transporter ATP-binding protein [Candidatus Cloacimonadota bacterium]MBT7469458.1 ABC transporter ATP-binding protein [Candidatus Cloacimonadota bacterium]
MRTLIEVQNLKKHYQRGTETVKALDGIDFAIKSGEVVSVVGPSGSGKTTLMNLISCLDVASAGNLFINGQNVTKFKEKQLIKIRRENIGFIFQKFYLIPSLTVKENIELPLIFAKKDFDEKKTQTVMATVGLQQKDDIRVNMLSGGDKQRVAIARALMNDPQLLIADEPTGKLETQVRDSILLLFEELSRKGLAIFIATHDLDLAEKTHRIIHLQDGRIIPKVESSLY